MCQRVDIGEDRSQNRFQHELPITGKRLMGFQNVLDDGTLNSSRGIDFMTEIS